MQHMLKGEINQPQIWFAIWKQPSVMITLESTEHHKTPVLQQLL